MRKIEGSEEVLVNLFRKQRLLERGDASHKKIRTAMSGGDGLLFGANGAGFARAIERAGLSRVFDVVRALSTSIPMAAYMLALQAFSGASIYAEECATEHFFSRKRKPFMDVDWLGSVFSGLTSPQKKLNQEAVRACRTKFEAVLKNFETGENECFDMKRATNMIDVMCAGIAIPGWSRGEVTIDGVRYGDARPHMLLENLFEMHRPTDLLIILNYPEPKQGDKAWSEVFARELDFARSQKDCRVLIVSGWGGMSAFERSAVTLRAAVEGSDEFFFAALAEAKALAERGP